MEDVGSEDEKKVVWSGLEYKDTHDDDGKYLLLALVHESAARGVDATGEMEVTTTDKESTVRGGGDDGVDIGERGMVKIDADDDAAALVIWLGSSSSCVDTTVAFTGVEVLEKALDDAGCDDDEAAMWLTVTVTGRWTRVGEVDDDGDDDGFNNREALLLTAGEDVLENLVSHFDEEMTEGDGDGGGDGDPVEDVEERDDDDGDEKPESQDTLDIEGEEEVTNNEDDVDAIEVLNGEGVNVSDKRLAHVMIVLTGVRVTGREGVLDFRAITSWSSCSDSVSVLDWSRLRRQEILDLRLRA